MPATRTASTPAPAPGSPRAARARPPVRRRCARGPRRRATAARGRRPPPPAATAGASAPRPAPPPPRARPGSACTPCGGPGRANRCVGTPSSSTCESRVTARRDAFAQAPGAHCAVPQGQFSFALPPQMVQVSRNFKALARAFLISYSFCFFCHSISTASSRTSPEGVASPPASPDFIVIPPCASKVSRRFRSRPIHHGSAPAVVARVRPRAIAPPRRRRAQITLLASPHRPARAQRSSRPSAWGRGRSSSRARPSASAPT